MAAYPPFRFSAPAAGAAPDLRGLPAATIGSPPTSAVAELFPQAPPLTIGQADAVVPAATGGLKGFAQSAGSTVAGGARSLGKSIASNPLGAANVALGLAGALQYATAKAPKLPGRPDAYAPSIRPAQGLNSQALEQGRASISAGQRQAGQPTTSDTATGAVQRLLAQRQAAEANNQLTARDAEAYQQDQRREDSERNGAYDTNYKTQRGYEQQKFDVQQRGFEARHQQSAAMAQNALTYLSQQQASRQQGQQLRLESQNRQAEARNGQLVTALRSEADPARQQALKAEILKNDPAYESTLRGLHPELFAAGGSLPGSVNVHVSKSGKRRITPLPNSVDSHHAATREFGQQMQRITAQAQRAFARSLALASEKRAKGLR